MWKWVEMLDYPVQLWWQPVSNLPSLMTWLLDRAKTHVEWLDDNSKYINIRFDSRTGNFLVRHDKKDQLLVWIDE